MTRKTLASALLLTPFLTGLLGLGCVNPKAGDTSSTPLYVYDETNKAVLVWNDVNSIYNLATAGTTTATAAPSPDRTITSSSLISSLGTLAWGGMAYNPSTNELFLVSEAGTVVRVENASNQNGNLSQVLDIATFTLGSPSTDRLTNSIFSQTSIDPSTGTLYVAETGSNGTCRIWVVGGPNAIFNNGIAPSGTYIQNILGPTGGFGATVGSSGNVFGFFTGGLTVPDLINQTSYSGPRIHLATGSTTFNPTQNLVIGDKTLLWDGTNTPAYGTLAFDSTNNVLYAARPIASGNAVVVFNQSQFTGGNMNQAPARVLADTSAALANLRFISHARTKDWLAGADLVSGSATTTSGTGTNNLYLWKGPSQGTASLAFTLGSTVTVRGMALDGSR